MDNFWKEVLFKVIFYSLKMNDLFYKLYKFENKKSEKDRKNSNYNILYKKIFGKFSIKRYSFWEKIFLNINKTNFLVFYKYNITHFIQSVQVFFEKKSIKFFSKGIVFKNKFR